MLKTGAFILLAAALWAGCGKKAEDTRPPAEVRPPSSQPSSTGGPVTSGLTGAPDGQAGGAGTAPASEAGVTEFSFPPEWQNCAEDEQCARVRTSCGCAAINPDFMRNYEDRLASYRRLAPASSQLCPAIATRACRTEPSCRKNRCVLF